MGPLTLVASKAGIRSLQFGVVDRSPLPASPELALPELALPGRVRPAHIRPEADAWQHLQTARGLLEIFFRGEPMALRGLAIDWFGHSPFSREVLGALSRVPWGSRTTYGALAAAVGRPQGARAVGQAMRSNPIPILIPCHRVLPATGGIGGFSGGVDLKQHLLKIEGWKVEGETMAETMAETMGETMGETMRSLQGTPLTPGPDRGSPLAPRH